MTPLESTKKPPASWNDSGKLSMAAHVIVILAGTWWMLGQLALVLRPLLIAIFLCYVLLPTYTRLRRNRVAAPVAVVFLAGSAIILLLLVSLFAYANALSLAEESPVLQSQALKLFRDAQNYFGSNLPTWLWHDSESETKPPEEYLAGLMPGALQAAVNVAFSGLVEAAVAGLYLLFLLLGAEKLPTRVRRAYDPQQAEQLLHLAGRINSAIIAYLKAKFFSSLIFAVPVGIVLWAMGVKFAMLWAVLTFFCNFIPYVGSVVAYLAPVMFAMLQFGGSSTAFGVAIALLMIHLGCAMLIEPLLIGHAVGLSPLVVLAALAVWGLIWGLPGMVLAVPLTAVVKIILDNIEWTRPIAKLIEE